MTSRSRFKRTAGTVLAAGLLLGLPAAVSANVYPSGLAVADINVSGNCQALQLSYVLNEDADGDGVNPGVKFEVLNSSDVVVRTITLDRQKKGKHTFEWDGRDDSGARAPNGNYRVKITAADYGYAAWTQFSSESNKYVRFNSPRGVAVNTDPDSPYYGRIYVSNSAAGTVTAVSRTLGNGIYVLNADHSDALGQDDAPLTGGVAWLASASSPYKISVGPDDRLYIGDWSDSHSGVWSTDPDVSSASGVEVLDSTGRNAAGLNSVHGSITSRPIALGTLAGGDMLLYAVDEDLVPVTSLWKWTIDSGPLPHADPPALISSLPISVVGVTADVDIGPTGKIYLTQYRSVGAETGLWVLSPDGATVLWNSLTESRALIGDPGAVDILRETRSPKVSPDGSYIALGKHFSMTDILPLDADGIPILTARQTIPTGTINIGRDVAWDTAGNLYVATSGHASLRIWSPPTGPHANATTSGQFNLNKSGSGGPVITAQPDHAERCPGQSVNFTVTATAASPTYQWKRNAVPLVDGGNISGATSSSLTVSNLTAGDDGALYTVEICDANGVAVSRPAILTVGASFAKPPVPLTVCVGSDAVFDVIVRSVGTPTYQWKKTQNDVTVDVGTNSPVLTLPDVQASDSGAQFRVEVTDSCGTVSSTPVTLTVRSGPVVTALSGNKSTSAGGLATYSLTAVGIGSVSYQWIKTVDGVPHLVGTDSPFLALTNIPCSDSGAVISCQVTDDCGTTWPNVGTLTVNPVAEICNNGIDDSCNGLVDCDDPACSLDPNCAPQCNDPFADADGDGDVDHDDFALFQACYTGSSGFGFDPENCRCFDRNRDDRIDGADFLEFLACVSGPAVPADTSCDDYPTGTVVINEISYSMVSATGGTATDDAEFVELYNAGSEPVDISGWLLRASDTQGPGTDDNRDYFIPGFPGSGTTVLPAGGYYVIGSPAVPNVDLVPNPSTDLWENDNEALELIDGNGTVVDTVIYELNKGPVAISPAEGGIWGNLDTTAFSWQSAARWLDGYDTDNNGRDFGVRPRTPGASNLGGFSIVSSYVPPDVNAMFAGQAVAGLTGSFTGGLVIDPGTADANNPNAIPASPQGGNAIVAWDPAGGGNMVASNDIMSGNGSFDLWVYFDTTPITVAGAESTSFGIMGMTDTFYALPDPGANLFPNDVRTANGNTGLAWVFNKDNANDHRVLFLVDAKEGGDSRPGVNNPIDWDIVAAIDMTAVPSGWYRLSISYTGATGAVEARFGSQVFNFSTAPNLVGGFYIGYRETLAGVPETLRPPTFDLRP